MINPEGGGSPPPAPDRPETIEIEAARMDLLQGRLPAALQLGGNEAVVGIDAVELSLSKRRLVATALELLLGTLSHRLICLALSAAGPGQCIDLGWGQCSEERLAYGSIDTGSADVLAHFIRETVRR